MSDLKPCPFCGGEADVIDYDDECWVAHQCANGTSVETNSYETEAEAIEAWNTRVDYHGYEQAAIEAWESIKAWNARATNGTLTAEQVKRIHEIIEKHWRDLPAEYDMPEATALPEYSYDWQAIADELNSRAERTCKPLGTIRYDYEGGYAGFEYETELSCGHKWRDAYGDYPNYCPNCGRKCI